MLATCPRHGLLVAFYRSSYAANHWRLVSKCSATIASVVGLSEDVWGGGARGPGGWDLKTDTRVSKRAF